MMWIAIPALLVGCSLVVALVPAPAEELLDRQAAPDRVELHPVAESVERV